jgi:hypothetical protein
MALGEEGEVIVGSTFSVLDVLLFAAGPLLAVGAILVALFRVRLLRARRVRHLAKEGPSLAQELRERAGESASASADRVQQTP